MLPVYLCSFLYSDWDNCWLEKGVERNDEWIMVLKQEMDSTHLEIWRAPHTFQTFLLIWIILSFCFCLSALQWFCLHCFIFNPLLVIIHFIFCYQTLPRVYSYNSPLLIP